MTRLKTAARETRLVAKASFFEGLGSSVFVLGVFVFDTTPPTVRYFNPRAEETRGFVCKHNASHGLGHTGKFISFLFTEALTLFREFNCRPL